MSPDTSTIATISVSTAFAANNAVSSVSLYSAIIEQLDYTRFGLLNNNHFALK